MKRIGIIGAGRFGLSLAESLAEAGQEVLLVERNGAIVQKARDIVEQAVQGDATNERTLDEVSVAGALHRRARGHRQQDADGGQEPLRGGP